MISQEEQKEQIEAIDLMFGNNYISFVNESNHGMTFNIFGIQKESTDNLTLEDIVSEISFNNENINVERFQVDRGFEHRGFRLFNLIVQISVQGYEVEEADEITLTFHGDQKKVYQFGKMILKNSTEVANEFLAPKGEYRVDYNQPDLNASIENSGNESLTVNEIYDLGRNITYHLGSEIILERNAITEVKVTSVSVDSSYDFYTITPILGYTKNAEKNEFVMPPVLYGVTLADEKKIDRIIRK